ncbi:GNAT family N-acetyltransferase [Paracoccus luteus]|uniref:GNAT family N-acetyltransferase n=1 Tax=Paracoccus luteus TaxID=2508543 RepID=UPI00106F19E2|nr:GNAT family N-acetyltransferase [Paracoccus luteus]
MTRRDGVTIAVESPLGADLDLLFERHVAAMHADTPPESIHMMPRAALDDAAITFLVLRDGDVPVGMGAIKRIAPDHGEIKSMHVLVEKRGGGLSRQLLAALIDHASAAGLARLSLETGVQPTFVAARGLYAAAGFRECPPFEGYGPDPNSVFMSMPLG